MKTFAAAYVNLLKTSIGSGVLSFPFLFKTYGILGAIFFTAFSGFLATIGLLLLTICSQGLGRSADLSKLATQAFPYARIVVDLSVFLKCFGVSLSYVIISKSLILDVLKSTGVNSPFFLYSPVNLIIFLGFAAPFGYFSKLDKLKYTSFIGVFCILLVIIISLFYFISFPEKSGKLLLFAPISFDWISGLGKFIFSFTCHQNIFAVNAEMEDNSVPQMRKLICSVAISSFCLYISFGLFNYLIFGSTASNNILNNYPHSLLGTITRILYIFVMGVSYPLQMAPARIYFMNMLKIHDKRKYYKVAHFSITTTLIAMTYLIAISGVDLGIVYSIVGATASCFMCLILPALFYIHLDIEKTVFLTCASYISFLFGIFIFSTTIVTLVLKNRIH